MNNEKNILVAGLGYVGLANALLLSQHNQVFAYDIDQEKLNKLKQKKSPIEEEVQKFLQRKDLTINFISDFSQAVSKSEILIIATPTNYDEYIDKFDTSTVETVIENAFKLNPQINIVIKSTIPVGFVDQMKKKYPKLTILFSPEFLREGKSLHDNLYPSRIIVGEESLFGQLIGHLFLECTKEKNAPIILTSSREAEAIKLFSNSYLALRIAYFNELDTFAEQNQLRSAKIIRGVSLDPRIGDYYNNPSFGYGGYCLPKDTKQLVSNFSNIPQRLVKAIVESNETRMSYVAKKIAEQEADVIGVYRISMKHNSDNFRYSSTLEITRRLLEMNKKVIIYEPSLKTDYFKGMEVVKTLSKLEENADIIIANRYDENLNQLKKIVYSRDLFQRD
ncbi:nucleotide sugar dehydrogenase [Enterococcus villorum]|uniref:nucleotide sugar dehydrogenase n=1 Tax=Enterococcus villorum TaxID=112904 RepID=UPI001F4E1456|nr:nucleotide sugar dehydrogenase [Enterococcus villorum]